MASEIHPLGSLARVYAGVPTKRFSRKPGDHPLRVLSVRALNDRSIDLDGLINVTPLTREVEKYAARTGDVILPARSTSFTAAILPAELNGVVINATLIAIRCANLMLPALLAAYLRHPAGRAAIEERSQSGTVQMNITVRALEQIPVPVPPIREQHRIVQMLEVAEDAHMMAIESAMRRRRVASEIAYQEMTRVAV